MNKQRKMDLDLSDVYNEQLLYLLKDPDNLQKWFEIINSIENGSVNELSKISPIEEKKVLRAVYSSLLKRFPYLENYWINFADVEFKLGNASTAELIYLNSLKQVPGSLKLWLSYLKFSIQLSNYRYHELILLFKLAEKEIGLHYHSAEFWDVYLTFISNYSVDDPKFETFLILRKLIELPIYQYAKYYKMFIRFLEIEINLLNISHFFVEHDLKKWNNGKIEINTESELKDFKVKIKKIFTDIYIANQYEVFKSYPFESKLKRQFFSSAYLSIQELDAWENYLNYLEIKLLTFSGNKKLSMSYTNSNNSISGGKKLVDNLPVIHKNIISRILSVYHRCLISTSLYDRFWIRLFWFYFNLGSFADAKNILIKSFQFLPVKNLNTKSLLIMMDNFNGKYLNVRDMCVLLLEKFPENIDAWKLFLNSENLLFGRNDVNYIISLITSQLLKLSENYNEEEDSDMLKFRGSILPFEYFFRFVLNYEGKNLMKPKLLFFQRLSNSIFAKKSIVFWLSYLKFLVFNIDKFEVQLSNSQEPKIKVMTNYEANNKTIVPLGYNELFNLFQLAIKILHTQNKLKLFDLFDSLIAPLNEGSSVDETFSLHLNSIELIEGSYW